MNYRDRCSFGTTLLSKNVSTASQPERIDGRMTHCGK